MPYYDVRIVLPKEEWHLMAYEAELHTVIEGVTVTVSKVGGGTLGRLYDGDWYVAASQGETVHLEPCTYRTPGLRTHLEVAQEVHEWLYELEQEEC